MTVTANTPSGLRRAYESRLAWAFVLSLLFHALIFGLVQLDKRFHFIERVELPAWLFPPKRLAQSMVLPPRIAPVQPPPTLEVLPMQYVDVNPVAVTAEAPKDTPYYSTANTLAANPTADKETQVPKIEGIKTPLIRTETVKVLTPPPVTPVPPAARPLTKPEPSAASAQAANPTRTPTAEEELKPKATTTPGDLTLAKPSETERRGDGQASQNRPKTFKEAVARLAARDPAAAAGLVGERMQQEGGVKRRNVTSSLDVRSSPFAAYDAAIMYAVQNRWYALLDAKNYAGEANGKLSLQFKLHQDGRVTDLKVNDQTVDEIYSIICQRAILDNAPYEKWPADMRRMIHEDYRDVTFTFYYN